MIGLLKNYKNILIKVKHALLSKGKTMPYFDSEMIGKNNMQSCHNPSNAEEIRNHFRLILYKKASDAYFNFGEKCLTSRK